MDGFRGDVPAVVRSSSNRWRTRSSPSWSRIWLQIRKQPHRRTSRWRWRRTPRRRRRTSIRGNTTRTRSILASYLDRRQVAGENRNREPGDKGVGVWWCGVVECERHPFPFCLFGCYPRLLTSMISFCGAPSPPPSSPHGALVQRETPDRSTKPRTAAELAAARSPAPRRQKESDPMVTWINSKLDGGMEVAYLNEGPPAWCPWG